MDYSKIIQRNTLLVLAILLAESSFQRAGGQEKPLPSESEVAVLVQQLESGSVEEHRRAVWMLQQNRRVIVRRLSEIARREEKQSQQLVKYKRHAAIDLIGKLECQSAIPILVENIEFREPFGSGAYTGMNGYSCALALQNMRDAALYPIIEHLRKTAPESISDTAIRLYSQVLLTRDEFRNEDLVVIAERARDRAELQNNLDRFLATVKKLRQDAPETYP